MKIQKIKVENFKAVENEEMNFEGNSAIITAKNNSGKTSILRGLIDRFKSEKPDIILKNGAEKGFNILELTDGSKIEWKFTGKSESFAFITKDGIKQTTGVISAISEKYFGNKFNIDDFLNSSSKKQEQQLLELLGVDYEALEEEYKEAYQDRRDKNRDLKNIIAEKRQEPEKIEKIDLEPFQKELSEINEKNKEIENNLEKAKEIRLLNKQILSLLEDSSYKALFSFSKSNKKIKELEENKKDLISTEEIESKIENAKMQNLQHENYLKDLEEYKNWVEKGKQARKIANEADEKVKEIENKKQGLLKNADLPAEFSFDESGLLYKGFPLTENQISSSAKYIAALKLAYMNLGEVKALHFDASTLDNISLKEVQQWADKKDLQLLIERPDMDGGEIKYEILSNKA